MYVLLWLYGGGVFLSIKSCLTNDKKTWKTGPKWTVEKLTSNKWVGKTTLAPCESTIDLSVIADPQKYAVYKTDRQSKSHLRLYSETKSKNIFKTIFVYRHSNIYWMNLDII